MKYGIHYHTTWDPGFLSEYGTKLTSTTPLVTTSRAMLFLRNIGCFKLARIVACNLYVGTFFTLLRKLIYLLDAQDASRRDSRVSCSLQSAFQVKDLHVWHMGRTCKWPIYGAKKRKSAAQVQHLEEIRDTYNSSRSNKENIPPINARDSLARKRDWNYRTVSHYLKSSTTMRRNATRVPGSHLSRGKLF